MMRKNYEPIHFEFFQSDMEYHMQVLYEVLQELKGKPDKEDLYYSVLRCKRDIQHKINIHMEREEWVNQA